MGEEKVITDQEIEEIWGSADFGDGNKNKRKQIFQSLYQRAEGYHTGHTITCIMLSLGLLQSRVYHDGGGDDEVKIYHLTRKGIDYLFAHQEAFKPKYHYCGCKKPEIWKLDDGREGCVKCNKMLK